MTQQRNIGALVVLPEIALGAIVGLLIIQPWVDELTWLLGVPAVGAIVGGGLAAIRVKRHQRPVQCQTLSGQVLRFSFVVAVTAPVVGSLLGFMLTGGDARRLYVKTFGLLGLVGGLIVFVGMIAAAELLRMAGRSRDNMER